MKKQRRYGLEKVHMQAGPPVTIIRNTSSRHWVRLAQAGEPFNSFAQ
jgi:hypothetical protein